VSSKCPPMTARNLVNHMCHRIKESGASHGGRNPCTWKKDRQLECCDIGASSQEHRQGASYCPSCSFHQISCLKHDQLALELALQSTGHRGAFQRQLRPLNHFKVPPRLSNGDRRATQGSTRLCWRVYRVNSKIGWPFGSRRDSNSPWVGGRMCWPLSLHSESRCRRRGVIVALIFSSMSCCNPTISSRLGFEVTWSEGGETGRMFSLVDCCMVRWPWLHL